MQKSEFNNLILKNQYKRQHFLTKNTNVDTEDLDVFVGSRNFSKIYLMLSIID